MCDETNVYMNGQIRHGVVRVQCRLGGWGGQGVQHAQRTVLKDKQSWGYGSGVGKEDSQAKVTGPRGMGYGWWGAVREETGQVCRG